jgi:hypothetical protein
MKPLPRDLLSQITDLWRESVGHIESCQSILDKAIKEAKRLTDDARYPSYADYGEFINGQTEQIWVQIAPLLEEDQRLRAAEVFYYPTPSLDFNGLACRMPSGETVLLISISLMLMHLADIHLYRLLGFFDRIRPMLENKVPPDPQAFSQFGEELFFLRLFARLLDDGDAEVWEKLPHALYSQPCREAEVVYAPQFHFVVLHELGHVCLGHLEKASLTPFPSRASRRKIEIYQPDYEMEHAADVFALQVMGAFFAFLRFVEERRELYVAEHPNDPDMEITLSPPLPSNTHPPFRDRFARLSSVTLIDDSWYNHFWGLLDTRIRPSGPPS